MHCNKQTNLYDALLCKMNNHICQLYQTNHGNIIPCKVIDVLTRNDYDILKYLEHKVGCPGEDIIHALRNQIFKHHVLLKERHRESLKNYCYYSRLYQSCDCCCQYLCSKFATGINFVCRYRLSACPHTQEIINKIQKQIDAVKLDEALIDKFTFRQLSVDLIQLIMGYYCTKFFVILQAMSMPLKHHYLHCLDWIKSNAEPRSYVKFYDIQIHPFPDAIINKRSGSRQLIDCNNNGTRYNYKNTKTQKSDPKKYNYFVKVQRKNHNKKYR